MIQSAKYNGINFSNDFTRESLKYNFDAQRVKNVLNRMIDLKSLSFLYDGAEPESIKLEAFGNLGVETYYPSDVVELSSNKWIIFFTIDDDTLGSEGTSVYFKLTIDSDYIFSEIYEVQNPNYLTDNEICKITAYNNDSRHGYLTSTNPAFGFFKFSKLKSDIFLTEKVEYQYSYSRKKILRAENQIAKRFTFHDLSMYNANLLKWLCNTENLYIDGVQYQLISEFTELESDLNSEILSLQADFVEANQSFFAAPSTKLPTNIFINQFFMS